MPVLANRLAAVIPYAWEMPLGDAVDSQVRELIGSPCAKPAGAAALRKMVDRLQTAAHLPIPPDPMVLRSPIANAFALPGGRIYVLSGLLKISETPDELAGVLSHELGHVAHRDGLRRLIRDGGTSFLVGLMFGDIAGSGAVLMAGRSVLSASYSRDDDRSRSLRGVNNAWPWATHCALGQVVGPRHRPRPAGGAVDPAQPSADGRP